MSNSAVTPTAFYTTLGRTDGAAVPAGYVGQKIDGTVNTVSYTSGTIANVGSISLTAGVWAVYGAAYWTWATLTSWAYFKVGISTSSSTYSGPIHQVSGTGVNSANLQDVFTIPAPPVYANVSSTTTYYLNATLSAGGTGFASLNTDMYLYAVRVA